MARIAREADACWTIRKTAIVDLNKLEAYIEKNCKGDGEDDGILQE